MKILFIACKYDYGKPELGLSFEYYNLYDALINMNNSAHHVVLFAYDEVMGRVGKDAMNEQLLETVKREQPDLCFFFLFEDQIKKETIQTITNWGVTTFNWFADDKWRFESFTKYWAPLFTWVSTDQESSLKDYAKIGYKNVIVGGWGFNPNVYKFLNIPKKYDITFVGQPHSERKKIIEQLQHAGINVQCFGRGWPGGKVSQEEMIQIFNQSKINLNFSACSGKVGWAKGIGRIFFSGGTFHNPVTWLSNAKTFWARQKNEIKGRNFEIPGCNAFLLTGDAPGLANYYEKGKELVCFYSAKDLIHKIKYYLNHEQEREAIAKAAYERTMRDYTYEKKFNEIFKVMGLV